MACFVPQAGLNPVNRTAYPSLGVSLFQKARVSFHVILYFATFWSAHAKTLNEIGAKSKAEQLVVTSLRKGDIADLQRLPGKDRTLRAAFLKQLIFEVPESEIPSHQIAIAGATIDGDLYVQGEYEAPVSSNITFRACTFNGVIAIYAARFERGLSFSRSEFAKGLFLDRIHAKSDVLLQILPAAGIASVQISLKGAYIDGQLTIQGQHISALSAQGMKLQSLRIDVDGEKIDRLELTQLESDSVVMGSRFEDRPGSIRTLAMVQANIKDTLLLKNLDIDEVAASGLQVGGRTDMSQQVKVANRLDFSSASLGFFQWTVFPCPSNGRSPCWPKEILLNGIVFRDIKIEEGTSPIGDAAVPSPTTDNDLTLAFLNRAQFSESAFSTYEHLLQSRGMITDADGVYYAMHEKRRNDLWENSKGSVSRLLGAAMYNILDDVQKVFLGYERSAFPPLSWSLAFVLLGTAVFWKPDRMESRGDDPPGFSAFWYSLELFLPVVDLGMAKSWRPKQSSAFRLMYARVHALAGWILIPVALAALTGAFR